MERSAPPAGRTPPAPDSRQLEHAIRCTLPGRPTLRSVCLAMGIEQRTLQRRLLAQGLSFQQVLDRTLSESALNLLKSDTLSISEISGRLGYSDPAHFIRAFRRWTGHTPGKFRRSA